ncbi:nitrate/nitrite transporter [Edaphobacter bradus]|uniref:nitrate/nitrite transporter n=1 Tax=Edaphobacter bradus TaxID=2259016 RepID=UPI0021DFC4B1|nr:nitrate/nitrite transporter [Edaphobacter bradus]
MELKKFLKSGHFPTLLSSLFYFDISFMVWVLLGPLAPFIAVQLKLSATQKGLLTAIPLLGGSLFRPILGILADRIGGRRTGLLGMILTLVPLVIGWRFAHELWQYYALGLLLGIAGASFAVALPLASRWYPPEQQGLVLGLAGAGNSGTLLATLFAPRIAQHLGVQATFAIAMIPVLAILLFFAVFAKDSQRTAPPAWGVYGALLREADTYWLSFFYCLTFGGFVGLISYLTIFFADQYHLSKVQAGDFTTLVVIAGSFLRPVGGWFSDKIGGYKFLLIVLFSAGLCFAFTATIPAIATTTCLLFAGMGILGMGNGAVFQLVPLRFQSRVGIATGIVGAAGGLGGFFLPSGFGVLKEHTGHYSAGFVALAFCFFFASLVLLLLSRRWLSKWEPEAARCAGILNLRIPGTVQTEYETIPYVE